MSDQSQAAPPEGGLPDDPERLVADARSGDNPRHRHFEWDDAAAAEKYRAGVTPDEVLAQAKAGYGRVIARYDELVRRAAAGADDRPPQADPTSGKPRGQEGQD